MTSEERRRRAARSGGQARSRGAGIEARRQPTALLPRARKRFGQHFLEPAWVEKLVEAVSPAANETFLEIGPGRGALTRALAPRVGRLVCIEIDRDLAAALPASVPPNVDIVEGDFLDTDVRSLLHGALGHATDPTHPVRVVGNLPYNISSAILFKLLDCADDGRLIGDATLMLQQEVAERLTAGPGTKAYGTLAVQIQRLADVKAVFRLPPGAFRPAPRVTSAVVRLAFRPSHVEVGEPATFSRIVRGVFLHRRKTMLNAIEAVAGSMGIAASDMLARAGIDPGKRPEQLTVAEFARLSRAVL
jgi:16S rRNA (adenine1518-N6/adenine1519-N6)-dimethyltransferase